MATAHSKAKEVKAKPHQSANFTLKEIIEAINSRARLSEDDITIPRICDATGKGNNTIRIYLEKKVREGTMRKELRFDEEHRCNVYAYLPCSAKKGA